MALSDQSNVAPPLRRSRRAASEIGRLFLISGLITTTVLLHPGFAEQQQCIATAAKPSVMIKPLVIQDRGSMPDVKQLDATVNLIGDPDSKSFGVSFRGTLTPEVKLAGDEKMLPHLYAICDNGAPSHKSVVVDTVALGTLKKGRESSTLIGTADATALVPLKDVECVRPGID